MDVTTPLGLKAIESSRIAIDRLETQTPYTFLRFSDDLPAICDGIILNGDNPIALYEVKSRAMSSVELFDRFDGEWLVSYEKIHGIYNVTKALCLSFVGVLYCTKDDVVLATTVWDKTGSMRIRLRIEQTETQKTVNGGTISRANAFLDMTTATRYT